MPWLRGAPIRNPGTTTTSHKPRPPGTGRTGRSRGRRRSGLHALDMARLRQHAGFLQRRRPPAQHKLPEKNQVGARIAADKPGPIAGPERRFVGAPHYLPPGFSAAVFSDFPCRQPNCVIKVDSSHCSQHGANAVIELFSHRLKAGSDVKRV